MILVGVDLHTREQSVAMLDTTTGEVRQLLLRHDGGAVEDFYGALPAPATVAIESTGYALWFHSLMQRLGHTLLVGDAAKIRATVVRRTKTDRRDARHILTLLTEVRFPMIWVPGPEVRDLRALVAHRMRLVRVRTMIRNGVHAIALNWRLALGPSLFTRRGVAQLRLLPLPPHTMHRRDDSLELLAWLDTHIATLEGRIVGVADANPDARRLMTHPGVGPLTALATIGPESPSGCAGVPSPAAFCHDLHTDAPQVFKGSHAPQQPQQVQRAAGVESQGFSILRGYRTFLALLMRCPIGTCSTLPTSTPAGSRTERVLTTPRIWLGATRGRGSGVAIDGVGGRA